MSYPRGREWANGGGPYRSELVLVLDYLQMPGMDGLEIIIRMGSSEWLVKLLAVVGDEIVGTAIADAADLLRAHDVLKKPVSVETFMRGFKYCLFSR